MFSSLAFYLLIGAAIQIILTVKTYDTLRRKIDEVILLGGGFQILFTLVFFFIVGTLLWPLVVLGIIFEDSP